MGENNKRLSLLGSWLMFVRIAVVLVVLVNLKNSLTVTSTFPFENTAARRTTATTTATTATTETTATSSNSITIDIISIGSIHRPEYQIVQQETFGSHDAVRNFFRFNELDDSFEPACHTNLTMEKVGQISAYCHRSGPHNDILRFRSGYARIQWLQKKANAPGWICAQKRLPGGLARVLKSYQQQEQRNIQQGRVLSRTNNTTTSTIPDYLIVMDDDTYLNMHEVVHSLAREYPSGNEYVVAGCMVRNRIHEMNFTFPFGGWSTILSARAIHNFIRPLHCDSNKNRNSSLRSKADAIETSDTFITEACSRLSENLIGEQPLFREGMSVTDLMESYVTAFLYLDIDKWTGVGFCMHSDWVVGYFVNFYNIARHSAIRLNVRHDRLQGYLGSTLYTGRKTPEVMAQMKECSHDSNDHCNSSAHICHYVTPDHMRAMFRSVGESRQLES